MCLNQVSLTMGAVPRSVHIPYTFALSDTAFIVSNWRQERYASPSLAPKANFYPESEQQV